MPTLPPEVLCEIFLAVAALYPASARNLGAPAFARVCQQWREVAFGYPLLWTTVNLYVDFEDTCFSLGEIEPYILLSAQLPLHVRLVGLGDEMTGEYPPGHDNHGFFMDELASEALKRVAALSAHRWKTLSVTGDLRVFAEQVESPTPLLESIEIYPSTWPEGHRGPLPLSFVRHAPLLRTMTLHVGYPTVLLPAWHGQVTSATYVLHQKMDNALDMIERHLADSGDLETLCIDGTDGDPFSRAFEEHLWDTVHHMHKLRTLSVSGCATRFLAVLVAPALESLTVSDDVVSASDMEFEFDPLSLMLGLSKRSTLQSLRTLTLKNLSLDAESTLEPLCQLLGEIGTLDTLRIEDDRIYHGSLPSLLQGGLLEWLTHKPSSPVRLPHLTHLTLRFGRRRFGDVEDLVRRLLASRRVGDLVEGMTFSALTHFTSDLGPEYQIP
ncbi:hypothetical protein K523DRAFT_305060 [Schizophyllum commune Tattone D]|nr:hypothetical protein K523DRAFT_305060 [Schizophyllum commune Tattone D]